MVIIGYSGTGKSVAIKHIVGLLEPDAGEVWVDGLEVPELTRRELYELRAQHRLRLPVRRAVRLAHHRRERRDGAAQAGRARRAPRSTSASTRRSTSSTCLTSHDRFPAELSGGMRKRVGIARAIALRPKYILYDEPTTGLDPVTSAVIDELMVRMREQLGVTSIVITHDMRSAYTRRARASRCCTRDACGRSARSTRSSTPTDPVVRQFIEGRADLDDGRRAWRAVAAGADGATVTRARAQRETSAGGVVYRLDDGDAAVPAHPRQLQQLGISEGPPRGRRARRGRRAARGARGDGPRRSRRCAAASRRSTGTSASAAG